MDLDDITTARGIRIPPPALTWRFSRSSAPGGQHVNTSSTRVDLRCDVTLLETTEARRERLLERLGPIVRVTSSQQRSQRRNREEAVERLCALLDAATVREVPRHSTRPTRASVARRREDKERQSRRKADRRWRPE